MRKRIEGLQTIGNSVECVWGGGKLKQTYDVDHCLPFARWPNNDLWNLMPSTKDNNLKKSDKLANFIRLNDALPRMQTWWQQAWTSDSDFQMQFWTEAQFSLPGLQSIQQPNMYEMGQALILQHVRLKEQQQLVWW